MANLAGVFDAVRDKILFHHGRSVFKDLGVFWNPSESWRRKWKNGDPSQGEAFPGSSGPFVFLTDAFHLFKYLFNFSIIIAGAYTEGTAWKMGFAWVIYSVSFHAFFTWIFERGK